MNLINKLLAVVGVTALFVSQAQAAVPTSVTSALGDAATDAGAVAALALGIVIAIYGFKAMRKGL